MSRYAATVLPSIDAAAENLLEIKKQISEDPKGKLPAVLCVLCGMANAAYQRPDGDVCSADYSLEILMALFLKTR